MTTASGSPWCSAMLMARHPQLSGTDLRAVLGAVDAISARPLSPEALEVLPSLTDEVRDILGLGETAQGPAYRTRPVGAPSITPCWSPCPITAADTVGGDRLVHVDLRADNVLIDRDGRAVIVDWPWAAHGASWFDALTLLVDARVNDPGMRRRVSPPGARRVRRQPGRNRWIPCSQPLLDISLITPASHRRRDFLLCARSLHWRKGWPHANRMAAG